MDSLGFWTLRRIPYSRHWIPIFASGTWILDSVSFIDIPDSKAQGSRFQDFLRFRIPQAKIFRIPEFGFPYMERSKSCK